MLREFKHKKTAFFHFKMMLCTVIYCKHVKMKHTDLRNWFFKRVIVSGKNVSVLVRWRLKRTAYYNLVLKTGYLATNCPKLLFIC